MVGSMVWMVVTFCTIAAFISSTVSTVRSVVGRPMEEVEEVEEATKVQRSSASITPPSSTSAKL